MKTRVKVSFDKDIEGIVVRLPHMVTLDEMKEVNIEFTKLLSNLKKNEKFSLLFDTGSHEFETIEALKFARKILTVETVLKSCKKFASVAPDSYIKSEIKSEQEATFSEYEEAYSWLKN